MSVSKKTKRFTLLAKIIEHMAKVETKLRFLIPFSIKPRPQRNSKYISERNITSEHL